MEKFGNCASFRYPVFHEFMHVGVSEPENHKMFAQELKLMNEFIGLEVNLGIRAPYSAKGNSWTKGPYYPPPRRY